VTRLASSNLSELNPRVSVPNYDRSQVRPGIVHIGVGGFHRAHEAMYLDQLMEQGHPGATDWGIIGVGLLPQDRTMGEVLQAQDCLYTLVIKHANGERTARVIGSVVDYVFAPDDPQGVLARMTAPETRIVSLTVTEGGYHVNQITGGFDENDPSIRADIDAARAGNGAPTTAFGYIVKALARRRFNGTPPFTVLSCDNIQGNGDVARAMITAFATLQDPELGAWIDDKVAFPNSMVDRITPVTTDDDRAQIQREFGIEDGWPVVCEPFAQWVLEDGFELGRPPLELVGVQVVSDVKPYELMKLRLLNAGHQAMCYLGYLSGYRYAHEVCQDNLFASFLLDYMEREAAPTLAPVAGVDLDAYQHELVERFANPEVRDTLARLCAGSSDRIPKFVVPVVQDNLAHGRQVRLAALVLASWARYAEGVDENGQPIEVVDLRRDELMERARRQNQEPLAFLQDPDLFGDLQHKEQFAEPYAEALQSLHSIGARATLLHWQQGSR
jgi:mannitol 2-dehydrogenase